MIPRYEKKDIANIWTDQIKFEIFLNVEIELLKSLEKFEKIPEGTTLEISKIAKVNPARILEIEELTRHDVIAFTASITEQIGPRFSKYFHFGVTSSDIIDTSLNIQIKKSLEIILKNYSDLIDALTEKALQTKDLITIGRSHGIYAEPMLNLKEEKPT
jgi:adenylosuccinate lyase